MERALGHFALIIAVHELDWHDGALGDLLYFMGIDVAVVGGTFEGRRGTNKTRP